MPSIASRGSNFIMLPSKESVWNSWGNLILKGNAFEERPYVTVDILKCHNRKDAGLTVIVCDSLYSEPCEQKFRPLKPATSDIGALSKNDKSHWH